MRSIPCYALTWVMAMEQYVPDMQAVQKELAAFEKRELEFKAKERQERAARLHFLGKRVLTTATQLNRSTTGI
jgi:hypothetical protein